MRWLVVLAVVVAACAPAVNPPTPSASPSSSLVAVRTSRPSPSASAAPTPRPTPTPTPPLDAPTAALVARLDAWCADTPRNLEGPPPLEVLGAIADGRNGSEVAQVLARSKCLLAATAHGSDGRDVVVAGAYTRLGVLLWADRGYWRIAPVPVDFGYLRFIAERIVAGTRELLLAIDSGGSGGVAGYLAVAIAGPSATVVLHFHPGASQMDIRPVDETHLLVTGRKLPERPWGITSNCCLPDGHEWLFERAASGYMLVGERQAQDPYYALNALLGAIDAGRPSLAADVTTPDALMKAAAFFGAGRLWSYKPLGDANSQEQAELLRWNVLPAQMRSALVPDTVRYSVARYEPAGPTALVSFERIGDRWLATDVVGAP